MAASGGFSFGGNPLSTAATTTAGSGSLFANATGSTPLHGGFNFGNAAPSVEKTLDLGINFTKPLLTQASGFNLGGSSTSTTSLGFPVGQPSSTTTSGSILGGNTAAALGSSTGLGGIQATSTTGTLGFNLGGTTAATGSGLLGGTTNSTGTGLFGGATNSTGSGLLGGTTSSGLGMLGGTTSTGPGLFGGTTSTTSTTAATTGFNFGKSFAIGTSTTTPASILGGSTGATSLGVTGSIFGTSASKPASSGLGGVDPKTTASSSATESGKSGDGKTFKETPIDSFLINDIEDFRKYVKEEKMEMEQMKRMSSAQMMKVQEDYAAQRQLLSLVASGLQRNACAVDKLKREMTQDLKNAEMAIRTKETPPGLQYENMAPTQYFHDLIENFENQMLTYRQQIEMLENHLASIHQPNKLTLEELILLLKKLYEAFIAMAAQLQQVHEVVKTQKEHYLNYRKVFLGDTRNIFERQKKAPVKVTSIHHHHMYGQSPFPGINNAAAVAMASALTRSQQPQSQVGAPPVTGFSNFQSGSGFGVSGLGGFGSAAPQSTAVKGFGTGGSLFGNTSNLATATSGSMFMSPLSGPATAQPQLGLSSATEQPFQLNKPPLGSKRGKR